MNLKKTALSAALAASLAGTATPSQATTFTFDWTGNFTFLYRDGKFVTNEDALYAESAAYYAGDIYAYKYYGLRTPITGTMTLDTITGTGAGSIQPFDFFGGGPAVIHDITMQTIGDGFGGDGTLILVNMQYDWGGNNNIAVEVVLDGAGLFTALPTMMPGDTLDQTNCAVAGSGCTTAASENVYTGSSKNPQYYPMGAIPIATTTYNVNNAGTAIGGGEYIYSTGTGTAVYSYTENDTIGGSYMDNGPFLGFSANFDMLSVTMTGCTADCGPTPVPVPAAIFLFGSGLISLIGLSKRKVPC